MTSYCGICHRELNKEDDPLSGDCGGDCWGCIGEMEADSGYEPSLEMVRQEFKDGYRNNWIPAPITNYEIIGEIDKPCDIHIAIKLVKPLGEPWPNEAVELKIYLRDISTNEELEKIKISTVSNSEGIINYVFRYEPESSKQEPWFHIKRGPSIWAYPI
jgi:hypothetical protein